MRRMLALSALAASTLAAGVLAGSPADAASSITASFSVTRTTSGPALYNLRTLVQLPMSKQDAEGYLWNGARIELRFYGEDPAFDNLLIGPITYIRSATGLSATDQGIVLDARWQELPGSWLNEDDGFFDGVTDEIYVKARWVDGDGATLTAKSNVVHGIF
jgi:hypothetical protein